MRINEGGVGCLGVQRTRRASCNATAVTDAQKTDNVIRSVWKLCFFGDGAEVLVGQLQGCAMTGVLTRNKISGGDPLQPYHVSKYRIGTYPSILLRWLSPIHPRKLSRSTSTISAVSGRSVRGMVEYGMLLHCRSPGRMFYIPLVAVSRSSPSAHNVAVSICSLIPFVVFIF